MKLTLTDFLLFYTSVWVGASLFWLAWTWLQSTRVKVGLRRNGKWAIYLKTKESYLWKVYQVDGVVQEWTDLQEANLASDQLFANKSDVEAMNPDNYLPKPRTSSWF